MNREQFTAEVLSAERSLYHIAKSILKNDEDCKDAMQNAILRAYKKLGTLRNEAFFRTWLTRILINECYELIRSRKEEISYEEYMEKEGEQSCPEYSGVYEALQSLPENYRIPFVLHYVEGYSVKETGQILKLTAGAVKVRLYRARNLMKEQLKGVYGYEED